MNPTGWTLQWSDPITLEVLGTVALEGLGALEGGRTTGPGIQFSFASHRASSCTIRLQGIDPKTAPQIPFEAPVVIANAAGTVFQGKRTDWHGTASPGSTGVSYTFEDSYYDLDHITFKQQPSITGSLPWPDCVLFQDNTPGPTLGWYVKTSDQLVRVLQSAIASGVNIQIGTIDLCERQPWPSGVLNPDAHTYQLEPQGYYLPFYPIRCIKISEAIKICLKPHPDCFTEIDYTTTPPTFNVRRRSSLGGGGISGTPNPDLVGTPMAAKTLPYAYTDADGLRHESSSVKPRPELQPRRIAIYYQIDGQTSGGPTYTFVLDAYGGSPPSEIPSGIPGALAWLAATEGVRAMDYSVNLAGPTTKTTTAVLNTYPFYPANLDLWRLKCQPLRADDICPDGTNGALMFCDPPNIKVRDNSGNNIDLNSFGWYIVSGSVSPWMGVTAIEANVSADFTYTKMESDWITVKEKNTKHTHHFRIKLCNYDSAANGNLFSTTQILSSGEGLPLGLAKGLFKDLSPMQYNLSHRILETDGFKGFIKPGKHAINLAGGATEWITMNAAVQSTDYTLHADGNGVVFADFDVRCGPVEHLEAGELTQLMNLFTNRRTAEYDLTARVGIESPSSVPMPTDTEKENSTADTPDQSSNRYRSPTDTNGNWADVFIDSDAVLTNAKRNL